MRETLSYTKSIIFSWRFLYSCRQRASTFISKLHPILVTILQIVSTMYSLGRSPTTAPGMSDNVRRELLERCRLREVSERSSDDCSKCSGGINTGKLPPLSVHAGVRYMCQSQLLRRAKKVSSLLRKDSEHGSRNCVQL